MPTTAYVYVPIPSSENFEIGLNTGHWGWRSSALDKAGARDDAMSLKVGDLFVLGHVGPNPRVAEGAWAQSSLKRLVVARITKPYFVDHVREIWPDEQYPERIGFDILAERENVGGEMLGADAMEALRLSANKGGVPLLLTDATALATLAEGLLPTEEETEEEDEAPADGVVAHTGLESVLALGLVRLEQAKLRRRLLNGASQATCALCGRSLPARFLRAAHIKRRSKASREERLRMANIMAACLLGCDELFEHGYVYVTEHGRVAVNGEADTTPDLDVAARAIEGREVAGHGPERQAFFAWHRTNVAMVTD
ncbi:hypothetical protein [Streptomyces sp. NPDC002644]